MSRSLAVLFILGLCACSEYDLYRDDKGGPHTGLPLSSDMCEDRSYEAEDVAVDDSCEQLPQTGQFEPVLSWHMETFPTHGSSNLIMATPMVAHITDDDGDGVFGSSGDVPDIAVVCYGGSNVLRVLSGDGSGEHWSAADGVQGQSMPAVGDLDGDGDPEIVVVTDSFTVIAYDHRGARLWESAELSTGGWFPTPYVAEYSSAPSIADMNGDGRAEVIAGAAILDGGTGNTLGIGGAGKGCSGAGGDVGTTSFAVDIDLDGTMEVVTGNALYDRNGDTISSSGQPDGYVAVADFDGDPEGEIVVVRDGSVMLYNHDWSVIWGPATFGSNLGGPPTVADFDGDGAPEIGVAGASIYTVLDTDGSILWSHATQDGTSGITGSSVFDFEGDGIAEVVYADEITLWVFDGPDGSVKLQYTEHASNTWLEYPVIADVDGNGHADIVLGHNPYQGGKEVYGISVIADAAETWMSTREVWNQHAYHITNVDDDGGIPRNADTNWDSYNNFRSSDLHAAEGTSAPDLVPEILGTCDENCAEGEYWIHARLRNEGVATARSGLDIVLLDADGGELDRLSWSDALRSGRSTASQRFVVDPSLLGDSFTLVADPDDGLLECSEDNNEALWEGGVCD
jgi:hypothetical protein